MKKFIEFLRNLFCPCKTTLTETVPPEHVVIIKDLPTKPDNFEPTIVSDKLNAIKNETVAYPIEDKQIEMPQKNKTQKKREAKKKKVVTE